MSIIVLIPECPRTSTDQRLPSDRPTDRLRVPKVGFGYRPGYVPASRPEFAPESHNSGIPPDPDSPGRDTRIRSHGYEVHACPTRPTPRHVARPDIRPRRRHRLLFAYDELMDQSVIAERCPDPVFICAARLISRRFRVAWNSEMMS
jgi:hypothetical protein